LSDLSGERPGDDRRAITAARRPSFTDPPPKLYDSSGAKLRIAGTAELSGYGLTNPVRRDSAVARIVRTVSRRWRARVRAVLGGFTAGDTIERAAAAARAIGTSSSTPDTERSVGRWPAARAAPSRISSRAARLRSISHSLRLDALRRERLDSRAFETRDKGNDRARFAQPLESSRSPLGNLRGDRGHCRDRDARALVSAAVFRRDGRDGLPKILVGVDVTIGPLLTLIISTPGRRARFDLR
jgi:hypothetical protein